MRLADLQARLDRDFGGRLEAGRHLPAGAACLLEFDHAVRRLPWSDTPDRLPDFRPLNDAPWPSRAVATRHLLRLHVAFWDWAAWPASRQLAIRDRVAIATIARLMGSVKDLSRGLVDARAATRILIAACDVWIAAAREPRLARAPRRIAREQE